MGQATDDERRERMSHMKEAEIQLAVRVPKALTEAIDQFAAEIRMDCTIERRVISPDETMEDLGFDPITSSPIVWVTLKFIGKAAVSIALSLLSRVIYDRLKGVAPKGHNYEMIVRFPTGESITIRTDERLDLKALEDRIKRSGAL